MTTLAKAKVEAGVRLAQTYILGRLRHLTFFSLAQCNAAIAMALERLNGRLMRRLGVSRRALHDAIERPELRPLPATPYEYAEWRFTRVGVDYHVEVKANKSTYGSPRIPSKCSTAASESPPTLAATAARGNHHLAQGQHRGHPRLRTTSVRRTGRKQR